MGATVCIFIMAQGAQIAPSYLGIMAPFGATMVILFALPKSPLAQPKNILGGPPTDNGHWPNHFVLLGSDAHQHRYQRWIRRFLMMLTNTLHPPAGANPILVLSLNVSWDFLFTPVLSGCLLHCTIWMVLS